MLGIFGYLALIAFLIGIAAYFFKFDPVKPIQAKHMNVDVEDDKPNMWISKGIKIVGEPNYTSPPINTKGCDLNLFHGADSINLYISNPAQTTSIQIEYSELNQYDKQSVLNYLKERKIIK